MEFFSEEAQKIYEINPVEAQKAINAIDFDDPVKYLWQTRVRSTTFFHIYVHRLRTKKGALKVFLILGFPFVFLFHLLNPVVITVILATLSITLFSSLTWIIYYKLPTPFHYIYLVLHSVLIILLIKRPLTNWYRNTVHGIPNESNLFAFNTHILKESIPRLFSSLYLILLFVLFKFYSKDIGDFSNYWDMLLFNCDTIMNTLFLDLPNALGINLTSIGSTTLTGSFMITMLKYFVAAGIVSSLLEYVNRARRGSTDFVGTHSEMGFYLVSYYNRRLTNVEVQKAGSFSPNSVNVTNAWYFPVAMIFRKAFKEKQGDIVKGKYSRNIVVGVAKEGLRKQLNK